MVITLTADTFDVLTQATSEHAGVWFVNFYAPWYNHFNTLKPAFDDLAPVLATVDASEHFQLTSRFRIRTYPIIMVFVHRSMYAYQGSRTVRDLLAFDRGGYATRSHGVVSRHI
ncbi:hypothetical protein DYB28_004144 [Aphanomyces astaci]|uniref:Thioredoxin domain-containing protein n=1 Tax=Aphanomyces astaci TaxID=112090 RepID=A0A9X8E441_APHAT|nr:hypothetical protein DYB28_004144 [Aphanomyces astaci]